MPSRLSILIPAAGASERLGQPKQLVQYQGVSLLQRAVDTAKSLTPEELIVITGAHENAVRQTIKDPSVNWVHNPYWQDGMGSSIALGAAAVNRQSDGLLILLCDQWRVQASDLQVLMETWQSDPSRIVTAKAGGQTMPPVIFPSSLFERIERLTGDNGARRVIKEHPELVTPVLMDNAVFDLDTEAHLGYLNNHP